MAMVAVAARSAYHERLVAKSLEALGHSIEPLPLDLEAGKAMLREARLLVLQHPWKGGDGAALLRALKSDRATRGVPVVGLAPADRIEPLRDAGAEQTLEVPLELDRLPAVVRRLTRTKKLILHADDSEITRKVVREFLLANGFDVEQAPDGRAAFELARTTMPDMIVTDVEMPHMTGYEFCQAVKADPALRLVPVLIVSSLSAAQAVEDGFKCGANDYITKPIDWNELLSRIHETFRGIELRGREKILVVDDEALYRRNIQQSLTAQGFEVVVARDGDEGYQKARDLKPDLIITDYEMPRLDGLQLFNYLKSDPGTAAIPVMMMSARDSKREQVNLAKVGVRAFLAKPFTAERLTIGVERLLAERRLEREKEHLKHYVSDDAWAAAHSGDNHATIRADEVEVAVLFSDICGFTPKCEKLTPRQIVDLLNEYFDLLCPVVKKYHGSIDKFVGDCIMAVFHHRDGQNGAENATRAGLEMQRLLHEVFNKGKPEPFENRVGINSGFCVQGDIGSRELRRDYTVIGDMVNIASRLEGAAEHGTTLVSEQVYQHIKHKVEAVPRAEPLKLKGKEVKVNAYKIVRFLV
jgi:DNA-binding response OmpR family regulator